MFKLYIPKHTLNNKGEVSVYAWARFWCRDDTLDDHVLYYKQLQYYCGFDPREVLDKMIADGRLHAERIKDSYRFFNDTFDNDSGDFVTLFFEHIAKLKTNHKAIQYYGQIASLINGKNLKSFMSIEWICEKIGCSSKTIIKYNKILEDLGILTIQHNTRPDKLSNVYIHNIPKGGNNA